MILSDAGLGSMFSVRLSVELVVMGVEVVEVGVSVGVVVVGGAVDINTVGSADVERDGCVTVEVEVVVEVRVDVRYDPHPVTATRIITSNRRDETFLKYLIIKTRLLSENI
jgi:hypothetical protein